MMIKKNPRIRLSPTKYRQLCQQVFERDNGVCVVCGCGSGLVVHHKVFRSQQGGDELDNLELLCQVCHGQCHNLKIIVD
jgi:5-methylcytosine-specific restriction endonuclease McrA